MKTSPISLRMSWEVEPSFRCPHRADIPSPLFMRATGRKILSEEIRRDTRCRLTSGRHPPMLPSTSAQTLLLQQTSDPFARTPDPLSWQFGIQTGTAIDLPIGLLSCLNAVCKQAIFLLMLTDGTVSPGVVPAHRHLKRLAEQSDRIVLSISFHDLIPHYWPCEKILTVFFRISRCWRVRSSSRLSRRFSSSKAL